jgi:hypothetical protein
MLFMSHLGEEYTAFWDDDRPVSKAEYDAYMASQSGPEPIHPISPIVLPEEAVPVSTKLNAMPKIPPWVFVILGGGAIVGAVLLVSNLANPKRAA